MLYIGGTQGIGNSTCDLCGKNWAYKDLHYFRCRNCSNKGTGPFADSEWPQACDTCMNDTLSHWAQGYRWGTGCTQCIKCFGSGKVKEACADHGVTGPHRYCLHYNNTDLEEHRVDT